MIFLQLINSFFNLPTMEAKKPETTVYDFDVTDHDGKSISMRTYEGDVLLIVNVASKCGLAKGAYTRLKDLLNLYEHRGFKILLFPCSQFLNQEFTEKSEIKQFADKYHKNFIMMDKTDVKGKNIHPLFKFLIGKQRGVLTDEVKWNFSTFLIDRRGNPVQRYALTANISDNDKDLVRCLNEGTEDRATNYAA